MYKILSRNGDTEFFDTYKDILLFLKNETHVLKNACHNFNDKRVECKHSFNSDSGMFIYETRQVKRNFMILDSYDRILNIPDLKKDCENISGHYRKQRNDYNQQDIERERLWDFRQSRNPKPYRKYYRRIKTQQERKWNSSVDHKPYVRPKRRPHYLDPWNIEKFPSDKGYGWKQFKKVRKQWLC